MNKLKYLIDNKEVYTSIQGSPKFNFGKDEILSTEDTDITFHQPWYDEGYSVAPLLNEEEFENLKENLNLSVKNIIEKELSINTKNFTLEKYHHYVKDDDSHFKVVSKTRDLFEDDFIFSTSYLINRLSDLFGFKLTDKIPQSKDKLHIIVRINRPLSYDSNPPHKDIYEVVDDLSFVPKFANFWIPISGVTDKTSLPLAPQSHKINEKKICRTFKGGVMEGNQYRVRMIKSWNGSNSLTRSNVTYGQVLMFSSHLIHGLALNEEKDITRVALEFRLFKEDDV